jgi:uroporphyrinogen-III synthase
MAGPPSGIQDGAPAGGGDGAPLLGLRVAVTRAADRSGPLAAALRRAGAIVTEVPLTRIELLDTTALDRAVARGADYDWLLLTSANGVEQFTRAVARVAGAVPPRIAVVGSATAAAARAAGLEPTLVPERFHAEALLDAMAERDDVRGARVLYPAAAGARDVLPAGLAALGAVVELLPVYRSAPDPEGQAALHRLVTAAALDLVTLAAPSAVDALQAALPAELAGRLPVACIGPVTARAARSAGFPVRVEATASTADGLVHEIVRAHRPAT